MTIGSKSFLTLICLVAWCVPSAFAQIDSAAFESEIFESEDLDVIEIDNSNRISAANRVLESADELPVRTIIITKDQIRRNGFITLVDVLKTLPGFRTSQPGSAFLGETFTMRGLIGNIYTKILVNGIPVEPSVTPGMGIGAQLPIQAAERIEIILGPAASVFGADAMAGVINIVMADVDRPVEAYGGASLGSQAASYLHLSLGGKLGKGKNVLDYNFYAASWSRDDINFQWKKDSLQWVNNYGVVANNNLWRGSPESDSLPNFREMPQFAQLLGVSVGFRNFSYNYQYMVRQDPSAVGSYFTDIDYTNANAYYGDVTQTHQLKYQKSTKKLDFTTNLSGIIYYLDENSSYDGIAHPISSDRNFMYGNSTDLQLEQLVNYRPGERWNLLFGVNGVYNTGHSFQNYLDRPYVDDSEKPLKPDEPVPFGFPEGEEYFLIENSSRDSLSIIEDESVFNSYEDYNFAGFAQAYYSYGKWKLIAGLRYDFTDYYGGAFSPKFGFFYKPKENIRLRGQISQGFRGPGNFYYTNNYRGEIDPEDTSFVVGRYEVDLEPETMDNLEMGGDFLVGDNWKFTVHGFYHLREKNLVTRLQSPEDIFGEEWDPDDPGGGMGGGPSGGGGPMEPDETNAGNYDIGFYNAESSSQLLGIQGFITYDNQDWLKVEAFGQLNIGEEKVEFEFLDTLGVEQEREFTEAFNEMPNAMGGLNLHFNIGKGIYLSLYSKVFSEYSWGFQAINDTVVNKNSKGGYYNIDGMASWDVGKRLTFYVRMNNVMRSVNKGLYTNSLSGYQFRYMPQQGRTILGGLTFDLNRKEDER